MARETAENAAAADPLADDPGPDEPGPSQQPLPARSWTERALRESADRIGNAMRHDIERDREAGE